MARWFLSNGSFELGNRNWTTGQFSVIEDAANARSGQWVGRLIGNSVSQHPQHTPSLPFRPGGKITASCWLKGGSGAPPANAFVRIRLRDKDDMDLGSGVASVQVPPGGGTYQQSTLTTTITDARVKFIRVGVWFAIPEGTWYVDDVEASGDIIEELPASAEIQSSRMIAADTVSEFEPLIGDTRFSEFNAGMSDRWAGVYNFVPRQRGGDLSELLAFIRRIGRRDRFFAYDPDHTVPLGGVVNGLTVDGAVAQGSTRIPIEGGTPSTTPLVAGDYVEVRAQYFQVQRDVEIGPEGTGEIIVWPSVRATIADGEDVITDNPKMVARITSPMEWPHDADTFARLSISWEEV